LTLLVTGFPGFIGGRLVRELLRASPDARVVGLAEPRMEDRAREAASRLDEGRVEVMLGDITKRRLGLSDEDYERLAGEVTSVYHLAAIYNLAVELELATKVNVDGTGNVMSLCEDCERLERLHYVSTAFVSGTRTGTVYEHELALGQEFKNHYESTKFQAEVWVRQAMGRVPTTIYRPAIVVGDSRTGETSKFDGPYYMLRVISRAVRWHQPIPRFGRAAAPFNVVPVDFVISAMTAAGESELLAGSTLHLVDPEPVTSAEVFDLLARQYAGRKTAYRLPPRMVAGMLRVPAVRQLFSGAPAESIRYLNHPVRFDTRSARELLEPRGVRCPRLEEYVEPLVEFFREHEDDPDYEPK
jgi:thioester reductase-like protein